MNTEIYHIVAEQFKGRITTSDQQVLQEWLDTSADNREVYAELEKVWKLTGTLEQTTPADVDSEWARFVEQRDQVIPLSRRLPGTGLNLKVFYRYAAVLLPLFMVSALVYFMVSGRNGGSDWITLTTGTNRQQLTLSDGTEVWVNRNSVFRYANKFSSRERKVSIKGEAFFKVAKTGSPFLVDAGETQVRVLGTRFNVNNYKEGRLTEVVVEEGKVLFEEKSRTRNSVMLEAGEKGTYLGKRTPISKQADFNNNAASWVNQQLSFDNVPLQQVVQDVARYFAVDLVLAKELENCLFSGEFSNPRVSNVLEVISLSTGSRVRYEGSKIYLEGGSCAN
ncbi:MAG: FecR domain-containing protein [Bacteroidales bacterium]|nr:FecR domain-containing protein [Bacteroidales bacterium]